MMDKLVVNCLAKVENIYLFPKLLAIYLLCISLEMALEFLYFRQIIKLPNYVT